MSGPEVYIPEGAGSDAEVSGPVPYSREVSGPETYRHEGACLDTNKNELSGPEPFRHEGSFPDPDSH